MNHGDIYHQPAGASFERFEPNPELLALAREVQKQNAAIIAQNAIILRFGHAVGIISGDVDGGPFDFTPPV